MGAYEYLEKYVRSTASGSLAWERSIFAHTGKWTPEELIDAAVDIAWDVFYHVNALERPALDIARSGNYFVISTLKVENNDFLSLAA